MLYLHEDADGVAVVYVEEAFATCLITPCFCEVEVEGPGGSIGGRKRRESRSVSVDWAVCAEAQTAYS